MARPSPITVSMLALAALVAGVVVYVLTRSPEPRADPPVDAEPPGEPGPPAPPRPHLARRDAGRPAPVAAPPPAAATAPPPDEDIPQSSPSAPDAAFRLDNGEAGRQRVRGTIERNQKIIRDGDEKVFETLKLPEDKRAAIRQINNDADSRARAALEADPLHPPHITEAAPERRAAIKAVLGDDGAGQFDTAEATALRHLRIQNRLPWYNNGQVGAQSGAQNRASAVGPPTPTPTPTPQAPP